MRWVIGDIHGMLRPLDALLSAVQKHDAAARFIFVGDYVNRGPDAPGVVDRLLTLEHATFLRGNHDEIFDLILNGHSFIDHEENPEPVSAFLWFMNHGLDETLMAYGAGYTQLENLVRFPNAERLTDILSVVPQRHREFFRALRPVAEFEDFFVAHAFWDIDDSDTHPDLTTRLSADPRLRHQVLWGRYTEAQIQRKKRWKRTGYFGHTPVSHYRKGDEPHPISGPRIVLLDTGVALVAYGRLSAVSVDDGQVIQADRAGKILRDGTVI